MSFTFTRHSQMPDIIMIDCLKKFDDHRGSFLESFRSDEFVFNGIPPFVQENRSRSAPCTVRGLHYQLNPKAQGKLVSCVTGSILDVAVDIRKDSPTYGQSVSIPLTSDFPRMIYIPPGFAHGFLTASYCTHMVDVIYKTTEYFYSEYDRGIRWDDPDLNISWGFLIGERDKLKISYKDRTAPFLKDAENNFTW